MSDYKVPQNVEAEDKLLGPFSFKQFIFLAVAAAMIGLGYGLSRVAIPLAVIPAPVALFFLVLALPLRKEQSMETYLAAIISFMLKPKVRLWLPDGIETFIEVTAPLTDDRQYGKGYSQEEVQQRMSYLANLVDSRGWAARGMNGPASSMQADLFNEAQATTDLLDDAGARAQHIDSLLEQSDVMRKQQIMQQIQAPQPMSQPQPQIMSAPYTPLMMTGSEETGGVKLAINPYPLMSQSVIAPIGSEPPQNQPIPDQPTPQPVSVEPLVQPPQEAQQAQAPSPEPISPVIMDLAHNHDGLSIETLSREAQRFKEKQERESEEVIISLR